jgi:alkaline phosphatase
MNAQPSRRLPFALAAAVIACLPQFALAAPGDGKGKRARNVIFFVGDGMGVSTVTATRVFAVGVDGNLTMDQMPYTALSRTYSADFITPDSAPTMSAMMSGVNTNSGVIGFGPEVEFNDFNGDGDGPRTVTLLELAEQAGMATGVISTARITHATPAACYSHINNRDNERAIALQALPSDATYNAMLGDGVEILMGGGRQFFVPSGTQDEEGEGGSRTDGRDLRQEFQDAGYNYIWNQAQFDAINGDALPLLALFERSHMEYEFDRPNDLGGEPSLSEMTARAIELLENHDSEGYFLMVESGRIDHAHHAGNAFRALSDCDEMDRAIAAAIDSVDLSETLIIVSADHSHVFTIAGYSLVNSNQMPYPHKSSATYHTRPFNGIFDVVYDIDTNTGEVIVSRDSNGVPYTVLGYANGPGYRGGPRVNPRYDSFSGFGGADVRGPNDPNYLQEATVPLGSETHSGEEVAIYAIGPQSWRFAGTVKNTFIFQVMREALGL